MTTELQTLINQLPSNGEKIGDNLLPALLQSYNTLPVRKVDDVVAIVCSDESPSPSIARIARECGDMKINAILVVVVTDLVDFFNVGKTMSPQQVASTVILIREEYPYFRIEDFKLCFTNAKKGIYGKVYDRIDGAVILEWLDKYSLERQKAFYYFHNKDKQEYTPRDRAGCTLLGPQTVAEAAAAEINEIMEQRPKYLPFKN